MANPPSERVIAVRMGALRLVIFLGIVLGIVAVVAQTAVGSAPVPSPNPLSSGMEGAKAALVRIELRAVAEIAHIDHSTGDVAISRGRSTVPLGTSTGVMTSADGVVATTWENLAIDDNAVAVYAGNELFANVLGAPITGNDGDPARRGSTNHPYWSAHLSHCYDRVDHCVLFRVPQYQVRTYTATPGGSMAELLNSPSGPGDVALLRISGGGGAPTASLAGPDAEAAAEGSLVGFMAPPAPETAPAEVPVTVDAAAGRISASENLAGPLDAGVSGGPVLDPDTGQVIGLAGPRNEDGSATLVPASAIETAMAEAGVEASPSKFDAVFRRGVDHLSSGNTGGSAESALEESLTYYDSALAVTHLDKARAMGAGGDDGAAAAESEGDGALPPALLPILAGVLLAGVLAAILLRRRSRPASADSGGGNPPREAGRSASAAVLPIPTNPSRSGVEDPGRTAAARAGRDRPSQAGRHRSDPGRAADPGRTADPNHTGSLQPGSNQPVSNQPEAAGQSGNAPRRTRVPVGKEPSAPPVVPHAGTDSGETRTAGPLAPRAAGAKPAAFCSQCGRPLVPGARFCAGCGHQVG